MAVCDPVSQKGSDLLRVLKKGIPLPFEELHSQGVLLFTLQRSHDRRVDLTSTIQLAVINEKCAAWIADVERPAPELSTSFEI